MKIPADVIAIKLDDVLIIKGKLGVKKAKLENLKLVKIKSPATEEIETFALTKSTATKKTLKKMIIGATVGFKKKLKLVGVGYKAQKKENVLSILLGFKNPRTISLNPDNPFTSNPYIGVKAQSKPAQSKPAESKPAESKPAESKPAESKAAIEIEVRGNGTIIDAQSSSHELLTQFISNVVKFKPASRDIYRHKGVARI
jgi:hypothetical protein